MKTKINHILPVLLLTAASGLTTVSCNDFLDKTPDNRTELNTDQKIAKLLVSAYPDVSPNELFELYSDNSDDSGPTYGYYQLSEKECYNWEDTKEEYQDTPNSLWGGYYGAISAANMALKAIEEKGNPASLNPQRGEALVCRAYCHFMLATIFCNAYDTHASESLGIPYMEDVETTVSPRYERGTLEEVYRKVERDLLEGVELISDDGYSVPKYHFTRKAAYAFAARFYLYYMKPDFSNCDRVIDFATRVLGSNPDDLLRDWEALSNLSVNGNVQADAYIASSNEANLLISSTGSNHRTCIMDSNSRPSTKLMFAHVQSMTNHWKYEKRNSIQNKDSTQCHRHFTIFCLQYRSYCRNGTTTTNSRSRTDQIRSISIYLKYLASDKPTYRQCTYHRNNSKLHPFLTGSQR